MTPEQHTLYTICLFLCLWSLSMWLHRRERQAFSVREGIHAVFGEDQTLAPTEGA